MRNVSKGIGAKPLRKRHLTKKEVRAIGAKRHLANYPDIALITERLAMGRVLLGRLSVKGVSRGERLLASAGGSLSQPQEPAAVSAEVRGHLLR